MLTLLRRRDFALLWSAGLISVLGDWVLLIALPFYVYDLTGSTLAAGAMFIVEFLPRVVFGSVAGVFVDRWDRKRTLIVADVARAVVLLPLLAVGSVDTLWIVYVVGAAQSVLALFFTPAKGALLPRLVEQEQLVAANALNSQAEASVRLVGPALGGALVGLVGLHGVVLADSLSFAVSAVLLALIATPAARAGPAAPSAAGTWLAVWREWLDGLRVVRAEPPLVGLFLVLWVVALADGVANVLFVPYTREVLGAGPVEFGWLISATGASRLIGLFLIGRLGARARPFHLILAGVVAAGAIMFVMAGGPPFAVLLVAICVLTPPVPGINVGADALVQGSVADAFRGRVIASLWTSYALFTVVGMAASSVLGDVVGLVPLFAASGVLYLAAGGVTVAAVRRGRPGTSAEARPVS